MNKVKKSISAGLLLICLILIMADYGFFPRDHAHTIVTCNAGPGVADHFEHSHSHTSVYNVICTELKSRATIFFLNENLVPETDDNLDSDFISTIWQPPKLS